MMLKMMLGGPMNLEQATESAEVDEDDDGEDSSGTMNLFQSP